MTTPVLELDTREVERAAAELAGGLVDEAIADAAARMIPDVADATHAAVRRAAARHRRTAKLDAAIALDVDGHGIATTAEIRAGDVAAIIIGGSKPHEIRSHGHALRLVGGRVSGFASSVHHPGTSPDPFVARGADAAERERASIVDAGAARLAGSIADQLED